MQTATESSDDARTARQQRVRRFCLQCATLMLVTLLALVPGFGIAYETVLAAQDARRYPPPGELVAVDGRQMHLNCTGEGSPTVVMDAGLGGWSLDWSFVQPEIAEFTRVCTYDRAGMGWSDTSSAPRDAQQAVRELHALLATRVPGPFVLVGHSHGGLRVLLYASEYPLEVAGVVLVDPTPIATGEEGFALLSSREQEELETLTGVTGPSTGEVGLGLYESLQMLRPFGVPRLLADSLFQQPAYGHLSAEVQPAYLATSNSPSFLSTVIAESEQGENSLEQIRRMSSLGDTPLTVLGSSKFSAFYSNPLPPGLLERVPELSHKMLWELQVAMVLKLSSNGTIQQVAESGHYMPIDRPDAVTQAVRSMIESLRSAGQTP